MNIQKFDYQKRQLLTAAFFIMMAPFCVAQNAIKIEAVKASKLINFALYNFDNLVADKFESQTNYQLQLAYLISDAIPITAAKAVILVEAVPVKAEDSPPSYMLRLNKILKKRTGFYFIDD